MSTLKVNTIQDTSGNTRPSGITMVDNWIVTSAYTTNSAEVMSSNWTRQVDNVASTGTVGSAMTQSSGVFTFPSTGIWLVCLQV